MDGQAPVCITVVGRQELATSAVAKGGLSCVASARLLQQYTSTGHIIIIGSLFPSAARWPHIGPTRCTTATPTINSTARAGGFRRGTRRAGSEREGPLAMVFRYRCSHHKPCIRTRGDEYMNQTIPPLRYYLTSTTRMHKHTGHIFTTTRPFFLSCTPALQCIVYTCTRRSRVQSTVVIATMSTGGRCWRIARIRTAARGRACQLCVARKEIET